MFDGLKDKLASFREDAAESVEENADIDTDEEATDEDTIEPDEAAGAEPDAESAQAESTGDSPDEDEAAQLQAEVLREERETDPEESEEDPGRLKRAAAYATGRIIIEEEDLEEPLWELEMALLDADVEMGVAEGILDGLRDRLIGETRAQVDTTRGLVTEALHEALVDVISVGQFDFDSRIAAADKPITIVFTGVNGVGKTTTIAKLARYFEHQGLSTVMANGDTYRAGANEQLIEHAENLDKKVITHEQGGDPAAVIYDAVEYAEANDVDVVLGDTAGRLHTSSDLMDQLAKIDRVVDPDMTLFVDEAVAGQDAVERAREFDEAAPFDGAVLTKADADPSGGAAISVARVTGNPVLFLGTGQGYEDIDPFDPEELVASLLGEDEE